MKKLLLLATIIGSLGMVPAFAQMGPRGGGPNFNGAMTKLFGANQTYSADVEFQMTTAGGDVNMPGKLNFDSGKARFEMNMSEVKGSQMPASALQQMKAMGMDSIISISRPDLKLAYLIYPGLASYAQLPSPNPSASDSPDDYKVETTELGKESVDGHDCVKNKVTVTSKDGEKMESTVWNASDLKDFPVKIVTTPDGQPASTMLFKNISFAKPASSQFEPPAGYTKYDNMQTMMQTEMMKRMGGGAAGAQSGRN